MRGCVGNSEKEATRRWNWASDLTSFSSGREDSRTKFRIRGSLSWINGMMSYLDKSICESRDLQGETGVEDGADMDIRR